MKTKKKINLSLILCAIFVAVLSCFTFFKIDKYESVKADSVVVDYYFVSSDTYHFDVYYRNGSLASVLPCVFGTRFNYVNGQLSFMPNLYYLGTSGTTLSYNWMKYFKNNTQSLYYYYDDGAIPVVYAPLRFIAGGIMSDVQSGTGILFDVYAENGFNANVYKIDLFLSETNSITTSPSNQFNLLNIKYTDVNEVPLTLSFYVPKNFVFNSRSYYLVSSDNLSDNQLYNQGFQDGLRDNQQNIYNQGYQNGLNVGYNNGYDDGIDSSNVYSFNNLLSAVIDTPITYFRSLFNFELLGVNLTDFFLGIFTLCVIVTILRMATGKR